MEKCKLCNKDSSTMTNLELVGMHGPNTARPGKGSGTRSGKTACKATAGGHGEWWSSWCGCSKAMTKTNRTVQSATSGRGDV